MKIFKYPLQTTRLNDIQQIPIAGLVEVLSIAVQHNELVLYAIVNPDSETPTSIEVTIVGTGHPFNLDQSWTFLGTHSTNHGWLMWHVWYREEHKTENEA